MILTKYKCFPCKLIIDEEHISDHRCPECNELVKEMCEMDQLSCAHDVVETIAYCPKCGEACCPICKCHDVVQVSRVTGYLQDVGGFNAGKRQELKDRKRYVVGDVNNAD